MANKALSALLTVFSLLYLSEKLPVIYKIIQIKGVQGWIRGVLKSCMGLLLRGTRNIGKRCSNKLIIPNQQTKPNPTYVDLYRPYVNFTPTYSRTNMFYHWKNIASIYLNCIKIQLQILLYSIQKSNSSYFGQANQGCPR